MLKSTRATSERQFGYARELAILLVAALALAACAQTGPVVELPDLVKDPRKLLTKDEQQRAISDLGRGKDAEITAAEKTIRTSH